MDYWQRRTCIQRTLDEQMSFHFECIGHGWQHFLSGEWGRCRRTIEVLDDQFAGRQIDRYDAGQVLIYDQSYPRDDNGMLIGLRFSRKPKWMKFFKEVRMLTAAEFDRAWSAATHEPIP